MEKVWESLAEFAQSDEAQGVDMVGLAEMLIAQLREVGFTLEQWQLFRMSANNAAIVLNHLIDQEIVKIQNESETPTL